MSVWDAVVWLHLLGMAFFVGGQLVLATVVVPALRGRDREALRAAARRFGQGTLAAAAVLVVTGIALATHEDRWGDGVLQAKIALVALVGVLVALHLRLPARRELDGAIFLASLAIVWLGVVLAR